MRTLLRKIGSNGWRWAWARIKRELRHPTHRISKKWIDNALSLRADIARHFVPRKPSSYLYCVYDLEVNAITFNLVQFLVEADLEARKAKKQGFVLLLVPPTYDSLLGWKAYDAIHDRLSKEWRIHNILLPLTSLSPTCRGMHLLATRAEVAEFIWGREVYPRLYDGKNLRGMDAGELHRRMAREGLGEGLRAPAQAIRYMEKWKTAAGVSKPIVTITLRTQEFDPARNSNLDEWEKFARYLLEVGFFPVVVPDTDATYQCRGRFPNAAVLTECAWNLGLRIALYEIAQVNFFVPNGCGALAMYSRKIRYVFMNMLPKGSIVTTPESYSSWGQEIGKNAPFAVSGQIMCYKPDTCENMIHEFKQFLSDCESAASTN